MTKQQIENGAKALYSEYQQRMSKFASSKWEDLYESGKYGWRATFLAALAYIREQAGERAGHSFVAPSKAVAPTSIPNSMVTNCHRCGKKAVLVSSGPLVGCPQGVSTLRCPDDECFRIQMDDAMKRSQQIQAVAPHRISREAAQAIRVAAWNSLLSDKAYEDRVFLAALAAAGIGIEVEGSPDTSPAE
jgi:hypothetical protein